MEIQEKIKKVAIIGAGVIGSSWATVFCRNKLEVNIYDNSTQKLSMIIDKISNMLKFLSDEGLIDKNKAQDSLKYIKKFNILEDAVKDVEYVQECIPENLELKQDLFKKVTDLTSPDVIVGSSCSGLRLIDITAKVKNHPERCIVAHPTNPPHLMPFMEIAGDKSSEEVKETAYCFMESVGQKPVRCKEVYGYVLNRVQLALIQEAIYLVDQGICSVEAVERALTDGLGLRWAFTGPYGNEELCSSNLEEGLTKYKNYMLEGFEELGRVRDYSDDFVKKAVNGLKSVMGSLNHEEYLRWRDEMVVRTRLLKERGK
jgi:3-hydroxyacyl-CoA dehydrogenase